MLTKSKHRYGLLSDVRKFVTSSQTFFRLWHEVTLAYRLYIFTLFSPPVGSTWPVYV